MGLASVYRPGEDATESAQTKACQRALQLRRMLQSDFPGVNLKASSRSGPELRTGAEIGALSGPHCVTRARSKRAALAAASNRIDPLATGVAGELDEMRSRRKTDVDQRAGIEAGIVPIGKQRDRRADSLESEQPVGAVPPLGVVAAAVCIANLHQACQVAALAGHAQRVGLRLQIAELGKSREQLLVAELVELLVVE